MIPDTKVVHPAPMTNKESIRPVDTTRLAVQVQNASVVYQTADTPVHALSDIDLDIAEGEFVSLIGPSGCGKTTLMRVIADLEHISAGKVLVNGVSPHDARLARAYGYVFQAQLCSLGAPFWVM